jgi:hypothetical protein
MTDQVGGGVERVAANGVRCLGSVGETRGIAEVDVVLVRHSLTQSPENR